MTPTASLFVRVNPGKVSKMSLQLMEKTMADATTFEPATELLLGRRYAIDATFFDEDNNPCTLDKAHLKMSMSKQLISIDKMMLENKPSPPHLIWAKDILLDYTPAPPRAEGEGEEEGEEEILYPIKIKLYPNSTKKPVQSVRFHWGTFSDGEKDLRRLSPVAPTAEAKFSRAKPKNVSASVTMLLPNPDDPTNAAKFWPCTETIKLPVRSDGALSLELLESRLAESAEARHCANAPMP